MRKILINVKDWDRNFDDKRKKFWIEAEGLFEYIEAELSYFTSSELLEGYKAEFTGEITRSFDNGLYSEIHTFTADISKYEIVNDRIYFDTYEEV